MTRIAIGSPLRGWACALDQVCDEVFSSGLAGDGLAIEPLDGVLYAPADGEIVLPRDAMHAISLRLHDGVDLLMHVGIDTVALRGAGFERLVRAGQRVSRGEVLLRFDLDRIARDARSAITPVLIASGGRIESRAAQGMVAPGDALFEIEVDAASVADASADADTVRRFRVPFEHGLHARPAAQIVAALRAFPAEVTLVSRGRRASARSTVALMGLALQRGDEIEVVARGDAADAALDALASWLAPVAVMPVNVPAAAETRRPVAAMRDFDAAKATQPELPSVGLEHRQRHRIGRRRRSFNPLRHCVDPIAAWVKQKTTLFGRADANAPITQFVKTQDEFICEGGCAGGFV